MLSLYTILWYTVLPVIRLLSFTNSKWKSFFTSRDSFMFKKPSTNKQIIIIHCASVGEYEQTKIIAQGLISNGYYVVMSFFSHSAYDLLPEENNYYHQKVYAPFDIPKEVRNFLEWLSPSLVIFVKYEFWYNWINILDQKQIPFLYVSVNLKNKDKYFRFPLWSLFKFTRKASHLFVQNQATKEKLMSHDYMEWQLSVIGDNRVESILSDKKKEITFTFLETEKRFVFIYGSIYEEEIEMINQNISSFPDALHLIFPHELDEKNIDIITTQLNGEIEYYEEHKSFHSNIIIFPLPGLLKHCYRYGSMAYIGGGFGRSIHNIVEALAHKCPVTIGPNHVGFEEIDELSSSTYIEIIENKEKFVPTVRKLVDRIAEEEMDHKQVNDYFRRYADSSKRVMDFVEKLLK